MTAVGHVLDEVSDDLWKQHWLSSHQEQGARILAGLSHSMATPRTPTMTIQNAVLFDQIAVEHHVFATLLREHRLKLELTMRRNSRPEMTIVFVKIRSATDGNPNPL
jgi:hypothetical protein